ncbi:MAG: hypothetical protein WBF71_04960 [Microthrixaceae bacterium]
MNHDEFLQLLDTPEPQKFVDELIGALAEVYRFNADRLEPEMGDDDQWFGFSVYRNGWYRIEVRVGPLIGVRTSRPNNSLQISVDGGVRFHVYRGGKDEKYDIYTYDLNSGTPTKISLAKNNDRQLSLFEEVLPEEGDHSWRLSDLVIVHSGNAEDGLTGVWVGAPVTEAADGSQWAWVLQLYFPHEESDRGAKPENDSMQRFSDAPEPDLDLGLLEDDESGEEAG